MYDPADDLSPTPQTLDTPVRPQHLRETYRASGKSSRREPSWKPGDLFGPFQLGQLLGQGSSGFVYEATPAVRSDANPASRVALKILVPETTEDLVRNKVGFRRMLDIRNTHLAKVDQIHRVGEHVALSMELIEGRTFAKMINELRRLDACAACEQVLGLMRHYALALSVMHTNYLIHRDVKPQNMMVDRYGNGRIIDYGLVGTIDPEIDPSGVRSYLAGTPQYMAPEVWFDQCYLPAGDIYSLGKVIFETLRLITGSKRLATQTPSEVFESTNIQSSIEELGTSVPNVLRDACCEMLETKPCDRPTAIEISRLGTAKRSTFLMPGEHRLFGRDADLAQIFGWLDGVLKGKSGRLHISGQSGIGKSRIVDEVVRKLLSRRWVHVFSARCQIREDQPLQAFDQICDALATRYAKEDLGVLEVDPGSAAILHQAFPVLAGVVTASLRLPTPGTVPARLDSLEAAVRVTHKILETGPMILVIDDAQWADQDSLNVLDRLQSERAATLGIITVSRSGDDLQRLPADFHLRLGPLSLADSTAMLNNAAKCWSVDVKDEFIESLAEVAEGVPFRLDELADEFRPGGAFSEGDASLFSLPSAEVVDGLWRKRVDRLSVDARRLLTLIATAGGLVSHDEIVVLQESSFMTPDSLEELRRGRLIQSEVAGDESISIVHDQVAQGLERRLAPNEGIEAHRLWAEVLLKFPFKQYQAARIAGHLFESGDYERAIEFADRAAIDAEQRYAKTEAARWHERSIAHLSGQARIDKIRQTAICYDEADRPVEAANHYLKLASLVGPEQSNDFELRALILLIRSGRPAEVRIQIKAMADRLGLPQPKSPRATIFSLLFKKAFYHVLRWGHPQFSVQELADPQEPVDEHLRLCLELSRPLCLLDNLYGAELAISGAIRALRFGTITQKLRSGVDIAVFGSYELGASRTRNEKVLKALLVKAQAIDDPKSLGDAYSAIAALHILSARWNESMEPSETSLAQYERCTERQTFEIGHTQLHRMIAMWHLGKIRELVTISQHLFDQSITRNDLLGRVMACSGIGSCGWLAGHRMSEFDAARSEIRADLNRDGIQLVDYFESMAMQSRLMYEGRWEEAEADLERTQVFAQRMPLCKVQLCRVLRLVMESLVQLNLIARQPEPTRLRRQSALIVKLRHEKLAYCDVVADLHEGYLQILTNKPSDAMPLLHSAQNQATELGLTPLRLASLDAIASVNVGASANRLQQYLRDEGVKFPELFANLYALDLSQSRPGQRGSQKS